MSNHRRTQSWHEIAAFYRELIEERARPLQPMLDLVEFLASPRYGRSLFPCTSGDTLLVGRILDFKPEDGELQIQFDGNEQEFRFTYIQRPDEMNPWSRECEASEWRRVLERVLHKRLQWFHEG
jgi:hypothetical protein